jgi:hypothetical protein
MSCFVDVESFQEFKQGHIVCGDSVLSHRIKEENRTILVLSDGLGSGIKASVLATLTATMAAKFISSHHNIRHTAEIIMRTLPVCKVRKISYSTFTIIDITSDLGTNIIEYDNPTAVIIRAGRYLEIERQPIEIDQGRQRRSIVWQSSFQAQPEDRIVIFSDGVVQAGTGTRAWPQGWGIENARDFILREIQKDAGISARELAHKVVQHARIIDSETVRDDTTCAVAHFREARRLLVVTGPPLVPERDKELAALVTDFSGRIALCGGTTANIIARETDRVLHTRSAAIDSHIPPGSSMDGIDLVTEGAITLEHVSELLERDASPEEQADNAATALLRLFLESDHIRFIVGTRINEAHQDPSAPLTLELRHNIVTKIAYLLEKRHLKETAILYI